MDRCISCTVEDHERPPKTDHMPIYLVLDYDLDLKKITPQRDWIKVDWDEYNTTLKEMLNDRPYPEDILTTEEFDNVLGMLNKAIEKATEKHIPVTNHHKIYLKRWWNKDLDAQRLDMRWKGQKALRR
jgi:protein associated with RNAse G/E